MKTTLKEELKFLERAIAHHHKSYWVWFQRMWVTERIEVDWQRELGLCAQLLDLDARNCKWMRNEKQVLDYALTRVARSPLLDLSPLRRGQGSDHAARRAQVCNEEDWTEFLQLLGLASAQLLDATVLRARLGGIQDGNIGRYDGTIFSSQHLSMWQSLISWNKRCTLSLKIKVAGFIIAG